MAEFSLNVVDGWIILPSSLTLPNGVPRFHIRFPVELKNDGGAMIEMVHALTQRGFRHFRPREQHIDGPLIPFEMDEPYIGNVFSFAPGLGGLE
jgi:hypothetical protein